MSSYVKQKAYLKPLSLALTLGIVFVLALVSLVLGEVWFSLGGEWINVIRDVYVGFAPTWKGALLGSLWGFIDGFIVGFVIAALYNLFS